MRIQTRKQEEKTWELTFMAGIMSGITVLLCDIAALKDHKKDPKLIKELESILQRTLGMWGPKMMDRAVEQIETWEEEHWPAFLIEWRNNK
jgi:hypothetical protein